MLSQTTLCDETLRACPLGLIFAVQNGGVAWEKENPLASMSYSILHANKDYGPGCARAKKVWSQGPLS